MNESPTGIDTEESLLQLMTTPSPALVDSIKTVSSPLVLLGAGGKMGPTLAVLAKRAAIAAKRDLEVVAVSRFSNSAAAQWLHRHDVRTISADLFERDSYATLPDCANLIYLVGLKFGTSNEPSSTWAANTIIPSLAATRYPQARWSILSTGNVYPFVDIHSGGAQENHPLTPVGEYPNAAVARERVFEFMSRRQGTPMVFLRLNYAIDLRYGVLVDLATKLWKQEPIDLSTGFFNCIWQGDANDMVIRSLEQAACPPLAMNLTGQGAISVRRTALALAERMGREARFLGEENPTALLSNTSLLQKRLGLPPTSLESMIRWVAEWVMRGGLTYNKPTHFEVRDGKY